MTNQAHSGPQARQAMGSYHGAHRVPATLFRCRYTPSSKGLLINFHEPVTIRMKPLTETRPDQTTLSILALAHCPDDLVQQPT